jgi:pimeloyl-ACP methyl ester carboxylesterase
MPTAPTPTRPRSALEKTAATLVILLLLLLAAVAVPLLRAHLEAIAVLDSVAGQPIPPPLRRLASEPVDVTDLTLPTSTGPLRARLYTPRDHPNAPSLLLLHGVHHLGMDEPRLIAFARAMSATGLRVLTPDLPGIKDYQVSPDSIRTIGDAAKWLSTYFAPATGHELITRPGMVPVGIMGLSFSGGLALLAAADPAFSPSIRFVVAIGSHDSMSRVAAFYRTGSDLRPSGPPQLLQPHEYGALVLEYENLQDFVPAPDIAPLRALLRAHLYEDGPAEKLAAATLTPTQHAEATQLLDTTSPATRALLLASEAAHVDGMAGVSPRGHLRTLTTPVFLLHGAADNIIPSAETLWMASELPPSTLRATLISPVLSHLDVQAQPTALDRWRLIHFFALILNAAHTR